MLVTKEGRDIIFEKKDGQFARFDLKNKVMWRKTPKKDWYEVKNANLFFERVTFDELKFKDDNFKKFIKKLKDIFMRYSYHRASDNRFCNISSLFTIGITEREYLQEYINQDLVFNANWSRDGYNNCRYFSGIEKPLSIYDKHVIQCFKKYKILFNKRFENSYLNKNTDFKNMVISISQYLIENKYPKLVFNIFEGYRIENFIELVNIYKYDSRKLFIYLNSSKKNIYTLKDYCNIMKNKLKIKVYDKYPESLEIVHDLAVENYNAIKDILKAEDWKEKVLSTINIKNFEFKDKNYCIIYPKTPNEIAEEGCNMKNCVKSYIDTVMNRTCDIVFMRKIGFEEESFITVEVRDRKVRQREGKSRRQLNKEEELFIEKYNKYLKRK